MKYLFAVLFLTCLAWMACKNDPPANPPQQVPELVQETAAHEPIKTSEPVAVTASETPVLPQGVVSGSNVTIRKEASVQAEKLGSFDNNEAVEILETKNVNNDREAILNKPVTLKGSGGEVSLPKGKAVVIETYQSERNYYLVTYQDPQKGKLTAEVDASAVETITYSTWYRVKRANGETGWVLGKFLKIN